MRLLKTHKFEQVTYMGRYTGICCIMCELRDDVAGEAYTTVRTQENVTIRETGSRRNKHSKLSCNICYLASILYPLLFRTMMVIIV